MHGISFFFGLVLNHKDINSWTLTSFWVLDIVASFFTASYVNDTLSFSLADIAKGYLKSWFLFDITMLVPDLVGVVLELGDGPVGIFRLLKVRRILRLLRFVQILCNVGSDAGCTCAGKHMVCRG